MIIKSMGRKASNKMTGGRLKSPFMNLVRYMTRTGDGEKSQSVLWHGFYGHEGMSAEEVARAFEENAEYLKARKNGNVLYHEILSFSAGYKLEGDALTQAVTDIGQEYLRYRAPSQMAFGAIHHDTDHIHLHLMVSANGIGRRDREWLTKEQFAELQKALETFALAKYPELAQTRIYDRPRIKERLKTQTNEQAMKSRTGEPSRKERIKTQLHGLFEQASSREDLARRLEALGFTFYSRGKSVGVVERLEDGGERRHRLSTLGLEEHYVATQARIEGAGSRLYFSGMDIDTASNLAKTIGEVHFERFDALGNMRIEREALMTPPALRAMPDNQVLYLYANKRPALLAVTPYFERRDFKRRTETPPVVPDTRTVPWVELVPL